MLSFFSEPIWNVTCI